MNRNHPSHYFRRLLLPSLLVSAATLGLAGPLAPALRSPKDGDHFEVTKPLLFWDSSTGAKSYEVYIDGVKTGETPAAAMPVLNYGITTPLSAGVHHWFVKAIPGSGEAVSSGTSAFTIDPPGNWPAWAIGPFVRYGNNPLLRPQGTGWESAIPTTPACSSMKENSACSTAARESP